MLKMLKRDLFLSAENQQVLLARFTRLARETGGGDRTVDVPARMRAWRELARLDSYESLVHNDLAREIVAINERFVSDSRASWDGGREHRSLVHTDELSVDEFRELDTGAPDTSTVQWTTSRFAEFDRRRAAMHTRHQDDTLGEHALEMNTSARYDMVSVHQAVELPYKTIEYLSLPYYGSVQNVDDDSSSNLISTNWR